MMRPLKTIMSLTKAIIVKMQGRSDDEDQGQGGLVMDVLGFVSLVITGFTSCAEFGSCAFVHR